jgi:hypothetical protein
MNLRDIALNYPTDNKKGMQQPITWFLNDVMNGKVAIAGIASFGDHY